jgi:transcriptional regulator of acetoin/glycerol metabolism
MDQEQENTIPKGSYPTIDYREILAKKKEQTMQQPQLSKTIQVKENFLTRLNFNGSRKQTAFVLIGFTAIMMAIVLFLIFSGNGGKKVKFSPEVQKSMQEAAKGMFKH